MCACKSLGDIFKKTHTAWNAENRFLLVTKSDWTDCSSSRVPVFGHDLEQTCEKNQPRPDTKSNCPDPTRTQAQPDPTWTELNVKHTQTPATLIHHQLNTKQPRWKRAALQPNNSNTPHHQQLATHRLVSIQIHSGPGHFTTQTYNLRVERKSVSNDYNEQYLDLTWFQALDLPNWVALGGPPLHTNAGVKP